MTTATRAMMITVGKSTTMMIPSRFIAQACRKPPGRVAILSRQEQLTARLCPAEDGSAHKTNTNFQNPDLTLVDNPLSEGAQGLHGLFQGVRLGDADLGAIPEAEVGPFLPEPHGNVTVDVVIDMIDPLAI
jgi:hypothetical protein